MVAPSTTAFAVGGDCGGATVDTDAAGAAPSISSQGYEFKQVFGMVRIEWTKKDRQGSEVIEAWDEFVGIEWKEEELQENEEPVAWQRVADTFEDPSQFGEHLQTILQEQPSDACRHVDVHWKGGGYDCFAPGTITSLTGNDMTVAYDMEIGAKVQKVDVIDIATATHRKLVVGSNNPASRRVKAWIFQSHAHYGIMTVDGSLEKPKQAPTEMDHVSEHSTDESSSDSADDRPLSERLPKRCKSHQEEAGSKKNKAVRSSTRVAAAAAAARLSKEESDGSMAVEEETSQSSTE